jgi:ORF D-335-like protein.
MGNKVFTLGDIRIREVKGKYYVYFIDNVKERYVGPLTDVVGTYLRGVGPRGFEPRTSRLSAERSTKLSYGPFSTCHADEYYKVFLHT